MHTSMSIRELTRRGDELSSFDYIDIEDKKAKKYKGVFIPSEYAEATKEYLKTVIEQKKSEKKSKILKFAGILDGETENKKIQELKGSKS